MMTNAPVGSPPTSHLGAGGGLSAVMGAGRRGLRIIVVELIDITRELAQETGATDVDANQSLATACRISAPKRVNVSARRERICAR
jgi:Zn-dependent alcohol dehydrogenase